MLRDQPTDGDLVLQEVWRAKDALFAARGHSVDRLFADARKRQKLSGHPVVAGLCANRVRVDADFSATQQQRSAEHCSASSCFHPSKNRPQHAKRCFALRLVIGGRDLEAGAVSVRLHHGGQQGAKPKAEVVAEILAGSKERLP